MSKFLVTLAILLVSSLALSGCFTNRSNTQPTPTPTEDNEDMTIEDDNSANDDEDMIDDEATVTPADETGMEVDENAVNVTITGTNFKFEPAVIEAKPGQTVTVTLDVTEGFHDFVIDGIEGAKTTQMNAGAKETVTFVVPSDALAGDSYEYYCSVGQHKQMGMVGTLKVV